MVSFEKLHLKMWSEEGLGSKRDHSFVNYETTVSRVRLWSDLSFSGSVFLLCGFILELGGGVGFCHSGDSFISVFFPSCGLGVVSYCLSRVLFHLKIQKN